MNESLCECEHIGHGDGCKQEAVIMHLTDWGAYQVCEQCHMAGHMPESREAKP